MFARPSITEKNQLLCSSHAQVIDRVSFELKSIDTAFRLLCSECVVQKNESTRDSTFQINHDHQNYVISFPYLSAPLYKKGQPASGNNVMDFRYMEIEHIIVDDKSQGYSPRNIVYLADKNLLAACSTNGHISLWSIGEKVVWRSEFNVGKTIRFAKYINRGEHGTNYVVLGVDNELQVYELKEDSLAHVKTINCELEVNDVEWIPQKDKILIGGNGNDIQILDLKSFSLEGTINIETNIVQGPIHRLIYLPHKHALAIETKIWIYLISLGEENLQVEGSPKCFCVSDRLLLGLEYLPRSKQFILRSSKAVYLLDEDILSWKYKYNTTMEDFLPLDSQIIFNEDESQFMCEMPASRICAYSKDGTYNVLRLFGMVKFNRGMLEVIRDQHKVVVGDQDSGVFYVLRTNASPNSILKVPQFAFSALGLQENVLVGESEAEKGSKNEMEEEEVNSKRLSRSRGRNTKSARTKNKEETSKEQLKERAKRKKQDKKEEEEKKSEGRNRRVNKGKKKDGSMEIEKEGEDEKEEEEKTVRRSSRSRSKKPEDDKDEKKERKTKGKDKGKGKAGSKIKIMRKNLMIDSKKEMGKRSNQEFKHGCIEYRQYDPES